MESIQTAGMSKAEWLAARHPHIGGSEIGAVLGLNKYKTARQLWEEKSTLYPTEIPENAKMRAGKRQEQLIADYYADVSGREVEVDGTIRIHPEHDFASVSIDGIIKDNGDGKGPGVLECKNTTSMYKSTWEQAIPLSYYCQIQWGLAITGWKWGAVAVQVDGWELEILPVERDEDFISMMLEQAAEFWEQVKNGTPPDAVVADVEKMKVDAGKSIEADEVMLDTLRSLAQLREEIAEREKREEALTDAIKLAIDSKEFLVTGDTVLATYKTYIVKESFRAGYSFRKLDIKKPKKVK